MEENENLYQVAAMRNDDKSNTDKKIINQHYLVLKKLKNDIKGEVIKCFYIKGLFKWGLCILKEGKRGAYVDKYDRDIRDRILWQRELHSNLTGKLRLPRLLDSFEADNSYYIAIDYINGKSLASKRNEYGAKLWNHFDQHENKAITFLDYLLQLIDLLERLHNEGYIHRDVNTENFLIDKKDKLHIIDLELSYSISKHSPSPPFMLGTFGYMSPEQLACSLPTIKEDVYAVGATIFKVLTGIDPIKIIDPNSNRTEENVRFFISDATLAGNITNCLLTEAEGRPALSTIKKAIEQYKSDIEHVTPSQNPQTNHSISQIQLKETIQDAIRAISSPLMADEYIWFSESALTDGQNSEGRLDKGYYLLFSRGMAGILYLLSVARKTGANIDSSQPYIYKGIELLEQGIINDTIDLLPGLHFGSAGISSSISISIQQGILSPEKKFSNWIETWLTRSNDQLNFAHGIAGQGMAYWLCHDHIDPGLMKSHLKNYVDLLLGTQEKDGSWIRLNSQNKKEKIPGFANGVGGIIYFLLEYAQRYDNDTALHGAIKGLNWLMRQSSSNQGVLSWNTRTDREISRWWCEGPPGIALVFLKAYSILKEKTYASFARGALYNYDEKVVANNLSQCHGISGLGEIYLEAFRTLGDRQWNERAGWIVKVIMQLKQVDPHYGTYWLVQKAKSPVPDFMVGCSGVVHFLLRYCNQDEIKFPLFS
ncbi:protein kinase [Chitinophaga agrisoli]|uniref:Protein kinase n=1 Tax=Chitinophaga agrisoli TaxID=2607653 RepID=A0A5B2VMX9_9BACT|nr:lanthionine synthetase LanC family protein [Chitinophaga agrisoli]KAA2240174.1 protein kinase [Chitinophaga agrisoli]